MKAYFTWVEPHLDNSLEVLLAAYDLQAVLGDDECTGHSPGLTSEIRTEEMELATF
ncbi:hypothetical protein ACRRTK_010012 [Alexandromys fortis]